MSSLSLAIATYGPQGLDRVARILLDPHPAVSYVVSWQQHGGTPVPQALLRPDVAVHRLDAQGLSRNRNNAVAHCSSDIVLVADDDISYSLAGLLGVLKAFRDNPSLQVATFILRSPAAKRFPSDACPLSLPLPRGYWPSAAEIAFRRSAPGLPLFNPDFGLGAPRFAACEDDVFLLECLRRRLSVWFFPIPVGSHPHLSTGAARPTPPVLRAQGAVLRLYYPFSSVLRIPLKAFRLARARRAAFFPALVALVSGAFSAPRLAPQ